jgi:hypothetical protein
VHAANQDPTQLHRPMVRIVMSPDGQRLAPPPLIDLAEAGDDGNYKRSIIKVTDPGRWALNPGDFFV